MPAAGPLDSPPAPPGTTSRVLERIAHVPPVPMQSPSPAYAPGPKVQLTNIGRR